MFRLPDWPLQNLDYLVSGIQLGVKDLLVVAQEEAPSGPPLCHLPGASRSYSFILQPGLIRLDRALGPFAPDLLEGRHVREDVELARELPASAPNLGLHHLP